MAVTAAPYATLYTDAFLGVHNITTDTEKVALLTSSYTPDYNTHATFADVASAEVSGTGYTQGGIALASKTVAYNNSNKTMTLSAASISWTAISLTCRYAVIYKSTGTNSSSRLMGLIDFGQDRTYNAEPLQISFPSGVLTITAAS